MWRYPSTSVDDDALSGDEARLRLRETGDELSDIGWGAARPADTPRKRVGSRSPVEARL